MRFEEVHKIINSALKEDVGCGDITTSVLFHDPIAITAEIIANEKGVVCGLPLLDTIFNILDKRTAVIKKVKEGSTVGRGRVICAIKGDARKILTGERVALNFLSRLSGIATLTRRYADKIKPYKVKIMDTRKTTPGLRMLEKYAVRIGGGHNHRMGLWDQVLIKDNHLKIMKRKIDLQKSIIEIRKKVKKGIKIEAEVETLAEFKKIINARPDIILLDNMSVPDIKRAVKLRQGHKTLLEVSGGVRIDNVRAIAKTGIDIISVGALTHSAKSIDFSMEVK